MKHIRKKAFVGALSLLALCANAQSSSQSDLIPLPLQCAYTDGSYCITQASLLGFDSRNKEVASIASLFNEKFAPASGFRLPNTAKGKGAINLNLVKDKTLGAEGYQLIVNKNGIQITANKPAGLFYGMQTLLQLLPNEVKASSPVAHVTWSVPCVEITDTPQFRWRGLMLDVSRHWFDKEEVKRYIDQLAEYKMNVFHWHLTDDQGWRIEIKSLPRLAEVGGYRAQRVGQWWQRDPQQPGEATPYGGYYTHDDIKEVLDYAAKRYVRVIPEIDVPGHNVAALVAYPEMACFKAPDAVGVGNKFYGIDENSLCVGNEATFEHMEKIFSEVAQLFPDEYIHVGGDECFKGFWNKCPKCKQRMEKENLKGVNELQSYFIRRMESILKKHGKKLIGWDEIHEGGLAPEATVMSWRGMQGGIDAAKQGHHVIMTPNEHCYLDLYQGEPSVEPDTYSICRLKDSYAFVPVPEGIDPELILGGQGNLWTESVPTFRHAEYMTWPRGWALAEVLWSNPDKKEWKGFTKRVEDHFDRANIADINYAKSMYNAIIQPFTSENGEVMIDLSSELEDLDIYYTFDNTNPDLHTPKYTSPLTIPKDATWIRVSTYRGKNQIGSLITIPIKDIRERAKNTVRKVGNL